MESQKKIQYLKNIGKKDLSEEKEIHDTGTLGIGVCGQGPALSQVNRVTLHAFLVRLFCLLNLLVPYVTLRNNQIFSENHQILLLAFDTNNDCNFTNTALQYYQTFPPISWPTGKQANKERQKIKYRLQWSSAYLKYILHSLIDKFNIYSVQKCMSRKDLTPERTTMWDTLTFKKF